MIQDTVDKLISCVYEALGVGYQSSLYYGHIKMGPINCYLSLTLCVNCDSFSFDGVSLFTYLVDVALLDLLLY